MGLKKFVPKKVGSRLKSFSLNKFGSKQILDPKKLRLKKELVKTNIGPQNILDPKRFVVYKNVG